MPLEILCFVLLSLICFVCLFVCFFALFACLLAGSAWSVAGWPVRLLADLIACSLACWLLRLLACSLASLLACLLSRFASFLASLRVRVLACFACVLFALLFFFTWVSMLLPRWFSLVRFFVFRFRFYGFLFLFFVFDSRGADTSAVDDRGRAPKRLASRKEISNLLAAKETESKVQSNSQLKNPFRTAVPFGGQTT